MVQPDAIAHGHHHHVLDVRMTVDVGLCLLGHERLSWGAGRQGHRSGEHTSDRADPENPSEPRVIVGLKHAHPLGEVVEGEIATV